MACGVGSGLRGRRGLGSGSFRRGRRLRDGFGGWSRILHGFEFFGCGDRVHKSGRAHLAILVQLDQGKLHSPFDGKLNKTFFLVPPCVAIEFRIGFLQDFLPDFNPLHRTLRFLVGVFPLAQVHILGENPKKPEQDKSDDQEKAERKKRGFRTG